MFASQIERATTEARVICLGDFNIDKKRLDDNNYYNQKLAKEYESLLGFNGMHDLDFGYTWQRLHVDGNLRRSAIDQCITNSDMIHAHNKVEVDFSDHSCIYVDVKTGTKTKERGATKIRDMKAIRCTPEVFQRKLAQIEWEKLSQMSCLNSMVDFYTKSITEVLDEIAPYKSIKAMNRKKTKLPKQVINEMKTREDMKKEIIRLSESGEEIDQKLICQWKKQRNLCNRLIKDSLNDKFNEGITESTDMNVIWKKVKLVLKPERAASNDIKIQGENDVLLEKPAIITEEFNKFFKEKVMKLASKISKDDIDPLHPLKEKVKSKLLRFDIRCVKEDEVSKIIQKMKRKTSRGFDDISSEVLKLAGEVIIPPLTWIINASITKGVFPDQWKLAKVTPLHKRDDKTLAKNYRPVSLLSVSSMVLEKVVAIQVERHMEDNGLFGEFQFGFRKNKSTVSELLTLFDGLLEAKEKKKEICLLLYDLSAAFDTVDAGILLEKLKLYGFKERAMSWMSSYLSGRKQAVQIKGEVSSLIDIEIGTPQGSRLSPLLFTILMADLQLWTKNSQLSNFADDTQSIVIGDTKEIVEKTVKEESEAVMAFFKSINLVNNADKAALIYNSGRKGAVDVTMNNIGGEALTSKRRDKLLGLEVSAELNWEEHVDKLCKTLKQRMGLLRRIRHKIKKEKLPIIAEAIFTSKIRYGLAVYSRPRMSETDPMDPELQKLQVLQNNMMRVVHGLKRADHINMAKLREEEGLMSVNQLAYYHHLVEMYNVIWKNSSGQLKRKIQQVTGGEHQLRNETRGDLKVPIKPSRGCVGFSYIGPIVWNNTPKFIRENLEEKEFKEDSKQWILKNIPN